MARKQNKGPQFSSCVRVDLTFILEFNKNACLPRELIDDTASFIKAGLLKIIPKRTAVARFGDIHIVLGTDVVMTRMRPQDLERRRRDFIRWLDDVGMSTKEKALFSSLAAKVGNRGKEEEAPGRSAARARKPSRAARARQQVPRVRKAIQSGCDA